MDKYEGSLVVFKPGIIYPQIAWFLCKRFRHVSPLSTRQQEPAATQAGKWIYRFTGFVADFKMQVRAGGVAGCAYGADNITGFDPLPFFLIKPRAMRIDG